MDGCHRSRGSAAAFGVGRPGGSQLARRARSIVGGCFVDLGVERLNVVFTPVRPRGHHTSGQNEDGTEYRCAQEKKYHSHLNYLYNRFTA